MRDRPQREERGDIDFDQVVEHCRPLVSRICHARLNGLPVADIEDAIQETFLQLAAAKRRDEIANIEAWLTTVATRVCAHALRAKYRSREFPSDLATNNDVADVTTNDPLADAISNADERLWLARVAPLLPTTDLKLLHALYVQDLPYDEVARYLQVSNGNARVMAYRARQNARGVMDGLD